MVVEQRSRSHDGPRLAGLKHPGSRRGLGHRRLSGVGPFPRTRVLALPLSDERSKAASETIQLMAETVENPGVHLVVLLEGRQIARRISGHLIRIDLSHFIRARLR